MAAIMHGMHVFYTSSILWSEMAGAIVLHISVSAFSSYISIVVWTFGASLFYKSAASISKFNSTRKWTCFPQLAGGM